MKYNQQIIDSIKKNNILELNRLICQELDIHDALIFAIEYGNLEIVKYLVNEKNADIHLYMDYPLRWSAENGHLEMVKYLVKAGADIKTHDYEAQRWAMINNHKEVALYLERVRKFRNYVTV